MFGRGGKDESERARRSGTVSVIGADMVIKGDVAAGDELRVDGRIEGNVRCAVLDQGEGGAIAGDIEADEARIAGTVAGKVTVRSLVLEASARVNGDVSYDSLAIAAGARVDGRLACRAAGAADAETPRAKPRKAAAKDPADGEVAELFAAAAE